LGGFFDFLRRQPSRDVAHLLADVVPASSWDLM
jgi:hypothetical protein